MGVLDCGRVADANTGEITDTETVYATIRARQEPFGIGTSRWIRITRASLANASKTSSE